MVRRGGGGEVVVGGGEDNTHGGHPPKLRMMCFKINTQTTYLFPHVYNSEIFLVSSYVARVQVKHCFEVP